MGLAAVVFATLFVAQEEPAYFWDWTLYFDRYKALGALSASVGGDWLVALLESIRNADYNLTAVTPLLPAYKLFGASRIAYVGAIVALYLVPAAAMAARLAMRAQSPAGRRFPLWLFVAALLFWPFWFAALRGMPDIAGLVPLGAATLLVIETRYLTRASILQGLCLGALVWLSFLLRRWYAYADVALETMSLIFAVWAVARSKTERAQVARAAAVAFTANLASAAALVLAFQAPLVARILHTSYADMFVAYQLPLPETARRFLSQIGLACIVVTALGLIRGAIARNAAIVFMGALAALTACLFLQTQAPGAQHILPVCLWMFPIAAFGAQWPLKIKQAEHLRRACVAAFMLAGFASVFVPSAAGMSRLGRPVLPGDTYYPLRLTQTQSYHRLIVDLEGLLDAPDATFAVFASSPHLSGSLLSSLEPDLRRAVVPIADVDARDGLRLAPFRASFAIVTTMPALHLRPATQSVVVIPDTMIMSGAGPGRAYRRIRGPYRLDGDIDAFIYARTRPFSDEDAEALSRALQAVYPDWVRAADQVFH